MVLHLPRSTLLSGSSLFSEKSKKVLIVTYEGLYDLDHAILSSLSVIPPTIHQENALVTVNYFNILWPFLPFAFCTYFFFCLESSVLSSVSGHSSFGSPWSPSLVLYLKVAPPRQFHRTPCLLLLKHLTAGTIACLGQIVNDA